MKVLWIIADPPIDLVRKGEIPARYYNPGYMFDQVDVLTCSSDTNIFPAIAVGDVPTATHALWYGGKAVNQALSLVTLPLLVHRAVSLAKTIKPDVIRCGDRLGGYLGAKIKHQLGIPVLMSLHCDRLWCNKQYRLTDPIKWLRVWDMILTKWSMPRVDLVVGVYSATESYAQKCRAKNFRVIYNVVCQDFDHPKTDFQWRGNGIWINRVDKIIDIRPIIDACGIAGLQLHIYGGETTRLFPDYVHSHKTLPNHYLVQKIPQYDLMLNACSAPGIPKGVMEAMWCRVPVITTRSPNTPEFASAVKIRHTVDDWVKAIKLLKRDDVLRAMIGHWGRRYAEKHFHPQYTEQQWVNAIKEVAG